MSAELKVSTTGSHTLIVYLRRLRDWNSDLSKHCTITHHIRRRKKMWFTNEVVWRTTLPGVKKCRLQMHFEGKCSCWILQQQHPFPYTPKTDTEDITICSSKNNNTVKSLLLLLLRHIGTVQEACLALSIALLCWQSQKFHLTKPQCKIELYDKVEPLSSWILDPPP